MKRAFTMIELMVVVGIIGILMAVLIGSFSGSTDSARAVKCMANMHSLAMGVQSYCVAENHYPRASTATTKSSTDSDTTVTIPGWLSKKEQNDPYLTGADEREDCFDGGAIWDAMKGNRDAYVCPSHKRYAKDHNKADPLWSYAMSKFFDWGGKSASRRPYDGSFRRADRYLMFAELDYSESGDALDSVLDYKSGEKIGFPHTEKKNSIGHVCFADGHVEKLRAPTKGDVKELTKWLCYPKDSNGDFDIVYKDGQYKKNNDTASQD